MKALPSLTLQDVQNMTEFDVYYLNRALKGVKDNVVTFNSQAEYDEWKARQQGR